MSSKTSVFCWSINFALRFSIREKFVCVGVIFQAVDTQVVVTQIADVSGVSVEAVENDIDTDIEIKLEPSDGSGVNVKFEEEASSTRTQQAMYSGFPLTPVLFT